MRKPKQKIPLERDTEILDQYDYCLEEEIYSQEEKYSKSIGSFFISFSQLEHSLDQMAVKIISDHSDEIGLRVIKYLEMVDKINLVNDHYKRLVGFVRKNNLQQKKLEIIISKLKEISEFRNKLAHANWMTLDKRGFVRVDIKEDKVSGEINFRKVRITPLIIRKFIRQADALGNRIVDFTDNIFQLMG